MQLWWVLTSKLTATKSEFTQQLWEIRLKMNYFRAYLGWQPFRKVFDRSQCFNSERRTMGEAMQLHSDKLWLDVTSDYYLNVRVITMQFLRENRAKGKIGELTKMPPMEVSIWHTWNKILWSEIFLAFPSSRIDWIPSNSLKLLSETKGQSYLYTGKNNKPHTRIRDLWGSRAKRKM